jgi:class 3 adenylate cyclase
MNSEFDQLGHQVATFGWRRELALEYLRDAAPSLLSDPDACDWWVRTLRLTLSPSANTAYDAMVALTDVRPALATIRAPALALCPRGDGAYLAESRELAAAMPHARLVEFAGTDRVPWGKDQDVILDEVERFIDGLDAPAADDRALVTLLFTDIVGSTELAEQLGDRRWRELLEAHRARVRDELRRHRGREVDTAGDGFLAAFDGPARAIRCACAIGADARRLNAAACLGLHTGECDIVAGVPRGVVIEIGSRVAALAQNGEVLVTRTVVDLVAGSGLQFTDRGTHALAKGHKSWRVYAAREE